MIARRALLGALAVPAFARAQGRRPAAIGYVGLGSEAADRPGLTAFRAGLRAEGFVDGEGVVIQARHAGGDTAAAEQIIRAYAAQPVDLFLAPGRTAARAIRRIAPAIPVVAVGLPPIATDPELFASLARPGGSVTGFSTYGEEMSAKRVELLRELMPGLARIGILHNATDLSLDGWGQGTEAAAARQGVAAERLPVRAGEDLAPRLRALREAGGGAVIVVRDFVTSTLQPQIVAGADAAGLALVSEQRLFVDAGGLFSYGANLPDLFRRAAGYAARILRGEKPGELPIQLPTVVEFIVNLRAARTLGITVPSALLARADEVIE